MTPHPARTPRIRMRFALLGLLMVAVLLGSASSAFAATFNPEKIISNDNMRAYDSMSEKEIQAFLETQPGPLKDLVARDYDKVITLSKTKDNTNTTPDKGETPKRASRIIWEASKAWRISPKVLLTMLQKEQSLLTQSASSKALARAMGAGCPGRLVFPSTNKVATNRYPGFGNQVWHAARLLDSYGEGSLACPPYYQGIVRKDIYRTPTVTLHMQNIASYKLMVYNPSIGAKAPYGDLSSQAGKTTGNANFWLIYRRYFGSTFASPRMRPVYRFRNKSNGTYLYTTSIAERHKLRKASYKKRWVYEGAGFSWDTAVPSTQTVPVYRYKNKKTGKFSFSTSTAKYKYRRSAKGKKTWDYQGVAYRVAKKKSSGAVPVYLFKNKKTGGYLFTVKADTVKKYRTAKYKKKWRYEGRVYYLPRAQ